MSLTFKTGERKFSLLQFTLSQLNNYISRGCAHMENRACCFEVNMPSLHPEDGLCKA